LRLDIDYINRMSPSLDLKIMVGTAVSVFKRKGL